jgi:hypothetical protein
MQRTNFNAVPARFFANEAGDLPAYQESPVTVDRVTGKSDLTADEKTLNPQVDAVTKDDVTDASSVTGSDNTLLASSADVNNVADDGPVAADEQNASEFTSLSKRFNKANEKADSTEMLNILIELASISPDQNSVQPVLAIADPAPRDLLVKVKQKADAIKNVDVRIPFALEVLITGRVPANVPPTSIQIANDALEYMAGKLHQAYRIVNRPGDKASLDTYPAVLALLFACRNAAIDNLSEICYLLATATHEARLGYDMNECGSDAKFDIDYANRLGNGDEKSHDGSRYKGRGYVHITGKETYGYVGNKMNLDLVKDPKLAADPYYAKEIIALGMRDGWYTRTVKFADIAHDANGKIDFDAARAIVNSKGDKASTITAYAERYFNFAISPGTAAPDPKQPPLKLICPFR